jgi:hypothetical protein
VFLKRLVNKSSDQFLLLLESVFYLLQRNAEVTVIYRFDAKTLEAGTKPLAANPNAVSPRSISSPHAKQVVSFAEAHNIHANEFPLCSEARFHFSDIAFLPLVLSALNHTAENLICYAEAMLDLGRVIEVINTRGPKVSGANDSLKPVSRSVMIKNSWQTLVTGFQFGIHTFSFCSALL